ncbi:hypothetical protein ACFY4B_26985 [Kitasatospora sp. NPDC001261]|uniref:hypothetical protein n=1 Tax=Kitasatospora sp. NPDC001261 TaxID=3364012 RepID=UPI0036B0A18E
MDTIAFERAKARMTAAQHRVDALTDELHGAEAHRDRAVAAVDAFAEAAPGEKRLLSRRDIARQIGVTHPAVKGMVDRAREHGPATGPEPALVMGPWSAIQYIAAGAFGTVERALVANNEADIVLECGAHPAVWAEGTLLNTPSLVLVSTTGELLGVTNCNAGYGGTGPSASHDLLLQLGWDENAASTVFSHEFVELSLENGVLRTADESLHGGVGGGLESIGGALIARLRTAVPSPLERRPVNREDPINLLPWVRTVLDQPERYPWAAGERVARVYLDREASTGLQDQSPFTTRGRSVVSIVIEQGDLQLWCPAHHSTSWTRAFSSEQLQVLANAGLDPADLMEAKGGLLGRLMPRPQRPAYVEISRTGGTTLAHEPVGL